MIYWWISKWRLLNSSCTGFESSWPPSEWKLNSKDHVVFNKFLSSARALLPQWGKSASARASVSLAPVLGARALETGRTICHTLLHWILPQWVLPQWGLVWHHLYAPLIGSWFEFFVACFHWSAVLNTSLIGSIKLNDVTSLAECQAICVEDQTRVAVEYSRESITGKCSSYNIKTEVRPGDLRNNSSFDVFILNRTCYTGGKRRINDVSYLGFHEGGYFYLDTNAFTKGGNHVLLFLHTKWCFFSGQRPRGMVPHNICHCVVWIWNWM